MSEQHTPGPWRIDATNASGPMGIYSDTAEQKLSGVCWFVYARQSRETIEANTRLISAAPDLLDACGEAFERLEALLVAAEDGVATGPLIAGMSPVAELLYAALRKTRGE